MGNTFGERFYSLRREKGLTQNDLVIDFNRQYHFNFTRQAISQYEKDRRVPELEALNAFADYFGVSIDYLLARTDTRTESLSKDDLKLKIANKLVDGLRRKGHNLTDEDIDVLIEAADFALKMRKK